MTQKPSLGRIVLYQAHGSPDGTHRPEPRAAIITGLYGIDQPEGEVVLTVFTPTGFFINAHCFHDDSDTPKGGTWRWPPRV